MRYIFMVIICVIPLLFRFMINRDRHHYLHMEPPYMYGGRAISNNFMFLFLMKYILRYFTKDGYIFRFNCNRELITDC